MKVELPCGVEEGLAICDDARFLSTMFGADYYELGDWDHRGTRSGKIRGIELPGYLHPFAGGKTADVKIKQRIKRAPSRVEIVTRAKPTIVGAELVSCSTKMTIEASGDSRSLLSVHVKNRAFFPPPLGGMITRFMNEISAAVCVRMSDTIRDLCDKT